MTDAHGVARDQLRAFIERIERLEEEKKTIADDIKDVYGEAKGMGYIPAMIKKVIALRKKDDQERMEEELILDTYLAALGMIEAPFEQDDEPVAAAQTRSPAKPLQASRAATTVSARVASNQPETATQSTAARKDVPSATAEEGRHLVGNEKCQDKREEASHRQAGNQDLPVGTNSEIAPASHGEAEANSADELKAPGFDDRSGEGANTGGDDEVAQPQYAATHQAGASFKAPATFSLRPDCRNPGETCAGHGTTLCHGCKVAMREREVA